MLNCAPLDLRQTNLVRNACRLSESLDDAVFKAVVNHEANHLSEILSKRSDGVASFPQARSTFRVWKVLFLAFKSLLVDGIGRSKLSESPARILGPTIGTLLSMV